MSIPTGRAFAKALEEAGVISDLNTVQRIVIDIDAVAAHVYVQRIGDKRLLDAISGPLGMMLADAEPERAVRYWAAFAQDLLNLETFDALAAAGVRVVEQGPWRDTQTRMVLIEDAGAPPELAGREVDLIMHREGGGVATVAERRVIR